MRDEPVSTYTAADLGANLTAAPGGGVTLTHLDLVDRGRAGVVVPGATPAEQARALYERYLRARLEQL